MSSVHLTCAFVDTETRIVHALWRTSSLVNCHTPSQKTGEMGTIEVSNNGHDFTSSGLTAANINCRYSEAKNSKRIAGPYCDVNFGMVEFDWRTTNSPSVTLKLMDKNAIPVFKHTVHF